MRNNDAEQPQTRSRRHFLTGCLGLGAGLPRQPGAISNTDTPSQSDHERWLSQTDRLEFLGVPRDWSVIRQGLHPFTPERIAMLPSGESLCFEKICGLELRCRIEARIQAIRNHEGSIPAPLSDEKKGAFYATMDVVAGHYGVHDRFEDWVGELAFWDTINEPEAGQHLGFLPRFQGRGQVPVDCPPVDFWLFLFPEGIDWNAPDGKPVHALIGFVTRTSLSRQPNRLRQWLIWVTRRLLKKDDDWQLVARLGRVDAARFLNPLFAELLDLFPY